MPTRHIPLVLPALWIVGCIAAFFYSQQQHIPAAVAVPAGLAFLVEISLYAEVRRLAAWSPGALWASAMVPYLLCAVPLGAFQWQGAATLAALAGGAVCWFVVFGSGAASELVFVVLMAAVYLWRPFRWIYPAPFDGMDTLGQLMWVRIGLAAILRHHGEGIDFGFLPRLRDWRVGLRYFFLMLPAGIVMVFAVGFGFRLPEGWWWKGPGTFVGILWVTAVAEEVIFRALLQRRLVEWWGLVAGVAAASLLFGLSHLGFSHKFPNWKMAALATVGGIFYGSAFLEGKTVRASMVTHALGAACLKVFVNT